MQGHHQSQLELWASRVCCWGFPPTVGLSPLLPHSQFPLPRQGRGLRKDKDKAGGCQGEAKERKRKWDLETGNRSQEDKSPPRGVYSPSGPLMLQWRSTDSWVSRVTKAFMSFIAFVSPKTLAANKALLLVHFTASCRSEVMSYYSGSLLGPYSQETGRAEVDRALSLPSFQGY